MAGPKDYLTPEQYERWYKQHRITEKQRQWRLALEANPIKALPLEERGPVLGTFSMQEAFWHPLACECGSCLGRMAQEMKNLRMSMRPIPPAVKALVSHLPELPHQALLHLQAAVERAQ